MPADREGLVDVFSKGGKDGTVRPTKLVSRNTINCNKRAMAQRWVKGKKKNNANVSVKNLLRPIAPGVFVRALRPVNCSSSLLCRQPCS